MHWNSSKEVSSFTFLLAFRLMLSQMFLIGLQSGDLAGYSIRSMPFSSRNWLATRARWGLALSSIKTNSSLMAAVYGTSATPTPRQHKVGRSIDLEGNGIERMEWPARSPGCNPIENLWDNIKRKANKKVNYDTSFEDFQRILQRAGANLDQRRIQLWSTVCWRGVARWSEQMVDLSIIIEHFIHCDAY